MSWLEEAQASCTSVGDQSSDGWMDMDVDVEVKSSQVKSGPAQSCPVSSVGIWAEGRRAEGGGWFGVTRVDYASRDCISSGQHHLEEVK